jgi:hypothetical protein
LHVGHACLANFPPTPFNFHRSYGYDTLPPCVHAGRTPGRDRDHRHAGRPAAAGRTAAREAARRAQCTNNLKQTGLALQNYHEARRQLPEGWLCNTDRSDPHHAEEGVGWGWASRILPYVEENAISKSIDIKIPIASASSTVLGAVIPGFLCPSDAGAGRPTFNPGEEGGADNDHEHPDQTPGATTYARSNYVGMFGTNSWEAHEEEEHGAGEEEHHEEGEPYDGNGMFFANSRMPFRHVTDG